MRIMQVLGLTLSKKHQGKWYCSDSIMGGDGHTIIRYLNLDGQWGRTAQYFNTEEEVKETLEKGFRPDFRMDRYEIEGRQLMQEMIEEIWGDEEDTR